MKKIALLLFLIPLTMLGALTGEIAYVEGTVDIQKASGGLEWADIGMSVDPGDSIITGVDGYCEVSLEGGSSIKIDSDTVFAYNQGQTGAASSEMAQGEQENIFRVVMGQIGFKFGQLTGREPTIATTSTVCGIRGTEFTVIASADGKSLYVLSDGEVAVDALGEQVILQPDEGVEVSLDAMGEKFPVLEGSIDFSQWREQADMAALADPVGTMEKMIRLLEEYMDKAEFYRELRPILIEENDRLSAELRELQDAGMDEEAQKFREEFFIPNSQAVRDVGVNYRYYSLSTVSIRRYVVTNLYVTYRSKIISGILEEDLDFYSKYQEFVELYEGRTVPFLVDADI